MGVRTAYEIDYERYALKALRGDFMEAEGEAAMTRVAALAAATR